jgi:hypothetical protein
MITNKIIHMFFLFFNSCLEYYNCSSRATFKCFAGLGLHKDNLHKTLTVNMSLLCRIVKGGNSNWNNWFWKALPSFPVSWRFYFQILLSDTIFRFHFSISFFDFTLAIVPVPSSQGHLHRFHLWSSHQKFIHSKFIENVRDGLLLGFPHRI